MKISDKSLAFYQLMNEMSVIMAHYFITNFLCMWKKIIDFSFGSRFPYNKYADLLKKTTQLLQKFSFKFGRFYGSSNRKNFKEPKKIKWSARLSPCLL